jgi:hypothetical protein
MTVDLAEAAELVEHLRDDDGHLTRGAWLVQSLSAEVAELRARPPLTAAAAREALRWMRWTTTTYTPAMSEAEHELRAIAEGSAS